MGVENNLELCERLDELVEICEQEPFRFKKKEGLREIADICNFYTIVKHKQVQLTKYSTINTRFEVLELPYKIEMLTHTYRLNGKMNKFQYYIVIKTNED
jgi:hypothetical protein